jgi:hypothetical protein
MSIAPMVVRPNRERSASVTCRMPAILSARHPSGLASTPVIRVEGLDRCHPWRVHFEPAPDMPLRVSWLAREMVRHDEREFMALVIIGEFESIPGAQ